MTLRSSDLQSDSDLDSIRNSCDVFFDYQGSIEHETDEEPGLEHSQRHLDSVLVEEGGHQEHDGDRPPSGPTCIDELILAMPTRD